MSAPDFKKESLPLKIQPYEEAAKSMQLDQFVQQVTYPVLLFQRSTLWDPLLIMARSMEEGGETAVVSYDIQGGGRAFLSPITKRQTDPSDNGIYVGRDKAQNDLVVPVASVSSRHAIFRPPAPGGEHWTLTDLGTSNGTWVTDTQCQANAPLEIADGSYIRLGGNLIAWFLHAGRLWNVFNTQGELERLIAT